MKKSFVIYNQLVDGITLLFSELLLVYLNVLTLDRATIIIDPIHTRKSFDKLKAKDDITGFISIIYLDQKFDSTWV